VTGEIGRRNNLGVPHLVVYGTADEFQHVIAPSLEDAMVYAEYLANERDEQCFRVFELREVDMAIKRYYQVALVGNDDLASAAGSPSIAPPPGVAELTIVPAPGVDWPAPVAATGTVPDQVDAAGTMGAHREPAPPSSPVRIVELDEIAAATADVSGVGPEGGPGYASGTPVGDPYRVDAHGFVADVPVGGDAGFQGVEDGFPVDDGARDHPTDADDPATGPAVESTVEKVMRISA
jgi:hypothetical protein